MKPIWGSNLAGNKLLSSIISLQDLDGEGYKNKVEFLKTIDAIIDNGTSLIRYWDMTNDEYIIYTVNKYVLTVFICYIPKKVI